MIRTFYSSLRDQWDPNSWFCQKNEKQLQGLKGSCYYCSKESFLLKIFPRQPFEVIFTLEDNAAFISDIDRCIQKRADRINSVIANVSFIEVFQHRLKESRRCSADNVLISVAIVTKENACRFHLGFSSVF